MSRGSQPSHLGSHLVALKAITWACLDQHCDQLLQDVQLLVEQQPPQGVLVCDHAGLVINKFSPGLVLTSTAINFSRTFSSLLLPSSSSRVAAVEFCCLLFGGWCLGFRGLGFRGLGFVIRV